MSDGDKDAEGDDESIDPDAATITDYLTGALSPDERNRTSVRLIEGKEFFEKVAPILVAWFAGKANARNRRRKAGATRKPGDVNRGRAYRPLSRGATRELLQGMTAEEFRVQTILGNQILGREAAKWLAGLSPEVRYSLMNKARWKALDLQFARDRGQAHEPVDPASLSGAEEKVWTDEKIERMRLLDPDVALFADYLGGKLSPEVTAEVERRIGDDAQFFDKIRPMWERERKRYKRWARARKKDE